MVTIFKRKNRRVIPTPAKKSSTASKRARSPKAAKTASSARTSKRGSARIRTPRAPRPPRDWLTLLQGLVLGALAAIILIIVPDPRGLWEPWEAAWSLAAREMQAAGSWMHPTLNGWAFDLRSPLAYWPMIISYKLFGAGEFTARLAGAFWGGLLVMVIHSLAAGLKGRKAGAAAALASLACVTFWAASRVCLADLGLVVGLTLALDGLWTAYSRDAGPSWRFWLGMLISFALGGLGALILPLGAALLLGIFARKLGWLGGLLAWPALAGFVVLAAGVLLLVCLNNPAYWGFYLAPGLGSLEPYYLGPGMLLLGSFYLLGLLPWAWLSWRESEAGAEGSLLLPIIWLALLWLFSPLLKLGSLALALALWTVPAVWLGPALAALAGDGLKGEARPGLRWSLSIIAGMLLILAVVYPLAPSLWPGPGYAAFGASLLLLPCVAAGLALLVQMFRKKAYSGIAAPLMVFLALAGGSFLALPSLDRENSMGPLVEVMRGELSDSDHMVSYGSFWPGFAFYAGHPVSLAAPRAYPLRAYISQPGASARIIPDDRQFIHLLQSRDVRILVVAQRADFDKIEARTKNVPGLLLFEWARRGDWVLFSNRPL